MLLANFHSIRPSFESTQKETLDWLVDAHTKSESMKGLSSDELQLFKEALREKLWHVGCKPDRIEKRGHVFDDFSHRDWDQMQIYNLKEDPQGKNLSYRARLFDREVDKIFAAYYPDESDPPDDLIHVSCTGYVSPSGAQKIASLRGWGQKTTVTHAYHMGCYGSIPALRMACGFLKERADIVHTEICSLHSNPSKHETDQLVSQSLFADGFMKYSCLKKTDLPHLRILAIQEEIIPNSIKAMSWNVTDWGFQMTLAKEIPVLITRHLASFLERLLQTKDYSKFLFAIHPGGPKILLHIQELLKLTDAQMAYSFKILKQYGNMSSATLPHIWQEMLKDAPDKTPIVSLAFGPGLSVAGSLMVKTCGN